MRVEPETGMVVFAEGQVRPTLTSQEFLSQVPADNVKPSVFNEAWTSYRFRPEPGVAAIVQFHAGIIDGMIFGMYCADESED